MQSVLHEFWQKRIKCTECASNFPQFCAQHKATVKNVSEFMNKTGCELEDAYIFLRSNNWDIRSALELWTERQNATSPEHFNLTEAKRLSRGISRATTNINYMCEARNKIVTDKDNNPFFTKDGFYVDTQGATFILPDFTAYPIEFQHFLERDLIDSNTKAALELAKRLNWWCGKMILCQLWTLSTTGDGNCLLHAVCLSMFGFHDRILFLRQLQHEFLVDGPVVEALKRRWRYNVHKTNLSCDVIYSEEEWASEWQQVIELASTRRRLPNQQGTYESLEEVHILALAHMLRRVIIVISETMLKDSNNQPFAPIPFGGIYIPYECDSSTCNKTPLLITYDMAHFSSLVFMEKPDTKDNEDNLYMVPLVDVNGQLLPLQFCIDPGENFNWDDKNAFENLSMSYKEQVSILKKYLDVVDLSASGETDSDEESDQKTSDVTNQGDAEPSSTSRATKQLQQFGKQFGSIGKSMGKKIRKNFGSLTKIASSSLPKSKKSEDASGKFLVATMNIKKLPYHEEMTRNYLEYAKEKFMKDYLKRFAKPEDNLMMEQALQEGLLKCTNPECNHIATVFTSYVCNKCYENLLKEYGNSQFGIGQESLDKAAEEDQIAASISQTFQDTVTIHSPSTSPKLERSVPTTSFKSFEGLKLKRMPVEVIRNPRIAQSPRKCRSHVLSKKRLNIRSSLKVRSHHTVSVSTGIVSERKKTPRLQVSKPGKRTLFSRRHTYSNIRSRDLLKSQASSTSDTCDESKLHDSSPEERLQLQERRRCSQRRRKRRTRKEHH